MKSTESPATLAKRLTELFPAFAQELDGEELETFHQLILILAPVITDYLRTSSERTVKEFCQLVDVMVSAGDDQENAISTCLLEHASQLQLRKIIRPFLSAAAKNELR